MNLLKIIPLLLCTAALCAQTPAYELRGSIGATSFADEGAENHLLVAPSVRYYFHPRLAVEGELQYLYQNDSHHDIVLLPSLVWDIRRGRVVPYVSGGLGWAHASYSRFSINGKFIQFGGGVKIYLNDHWYVAPEFKVGFDLHARISGALGYTWRR
jgi:Outer membrane protein beta-barrel domain